MSVKDQPMIQCGYCAAQVPVEDYIRHDIVCHHGLSRVHSDHRVLCSRMEVCLCRITEYQAVAAQMAQEKQA